MILQFVTIRSVIGPQLTYNKVNMFWCYRLYRTERRIQSVSQKNLLDGQLIWQYVELSNLDQSLLAKQIGTEPHQVGCYGN